MGGAGRVAVVCGLLLAAAIAGVQAQKPVVPPAEDIAIDSILWSAERRLRWGDFLARPQLNTIAAAMTSYVLSYDADCDSNVFSFRVVSAFLPERSWVKGDLLMIASHSSRALQHEQTHFDLSEVHVRKIRRALVELPDPCGKTEQERDTVVSAFIREDGEAQLRYDRETGHGSRDQPQRQWDSEVGRQLSALSQFASNARIRLHKVSGRSYN